MKKQFIFFLLFPLFSLAQIKGQIVDSNNSPLEYATAALFKQADSTLISGVITDQKGNFSLKSPENGSYFLEASFIGYETKVLNNILITDNLLLDLGAIKLILGNQLNEVVVRGERATVVNTSESDIKV